MSKSKIEKFKLNPDNAIDLIRREILRSGRKTKDITFKIDVLQVNFLKPKENPDAESDKIVEQEKNSFDEKNIAYEWESDTGFMKVSPKD